MLLLFCDAIQYDSEQGMLFLLFGKNAFSIFAFSWDVEELRGSKRSSAFFARSFGCALFIFPKARGEE